MRWVLALLLATAIGCAGRMPPSPHRFAEPTGWSVCYEADGNVDNYEGNCSAPSLVQWSLPVEVYVPDSYPSPLRMAQGLAVWDEWLGREVFRVVKSPEGADVLVTDGGPAVFAAGMATHMRVAGKVTFTLSMYQPYYDRPEIIAHELGHVLGLAHDDGNKRSIMYPGMEWYLPELTDADCDYLEAMYPSVDCS